MKESYARFYILEYGKDIQKFMTHFWIENKRLIELKHDEKGQPYLEIPEVLFNYIDTLSLDQVQEMINRDYTK